MEVYTGRTNLVVIMPAMPITLDPTSSNETPSARILTQIFETLVKFDDELNIIPGLAESWKFENDTSLNMSLKRGVKFHNGEEFTASDAAFSIKRTVSSPFFKGMGSMISDVAINDDYNITVKLKEPFAPILSTLVHHCFSMVNKSELEKIGDAAHEKKPVGTGAFKLKSWTVRKFQGRIELSRFDEYHDGLPVLQNITLKSIPEATLRISEILLGTADIAYDISIDGISRIEGNPNVVMVKSPNFSMCCLGFNCFKKPFDDPRVRLAICHAINKDAIVKRIYKGDIALSNGPISSMVWGSAQDKLEPPEYNIEKARVLLKEAGYENGFKTSLCLGDRLERKNIGIIIQSHLRALNIDCEIIAPNWSTYFSNICEGNTEMFILDWVSATGDADYGLFLVFHSSNFGRNGNFSFYSNPQVDKLLEDGRHEMNSEKRLNLYYEAQKVICEDTPWLFLQQGVNSNAARTNVRGFKNHPAGHHVLKDIYFE